MTSFGIGLLIASTVVAIGGVWYLASKHPTMKRSLAAGGVVIALLAGILHLLHRGYEVGSIFQNLKPTPSITVDPSNEAPRKSARDAAPTECTSAAEHWRAVDAINTREAFADHLRRFPACAFEELARTRIKTLDTKENESARPVITVHTGQMVLKISSKGQPTEVYSVAVGDWCSAIRGSSVGELRIVNMAHWPDWHPTTEMRKRDPRLPTRVAGGVENPLGARAIYLSDPRYVIHGAPANVLDRSNFHGCITLLTSDSIDFYARVQIGDKISILP